jgi:hypothetical protein
VQEPYAIGTDVKLVYRRTKTVLPSSSRQSYNFKDVLDEQNIWLIGLKWQNGKAFFAMEKSNSSAKNCSLNFFPESIEAIRSALKRID